jgi:ABC-type transport system substrate-binding protein
MGIPSLSRSPFAGRLFAGLFALIFAITAIGWLTAYLAAQGSKKEEEEETVKPKKKPPVVEEEEERPSRPRKVVKVEDDDPAPAKPRPKPAPAPAEAQTSIVEALRETKNPELQAFYTGLKVPHDVLTVRSLDRTNTYFIEPLPQYYEGEQTHFKGGYIKVWSYDQEWRRSDTYSKYNTALSIVPYEEIVLNAVDEFLKKDFDRLPRGNKRYLSRADMLKAAETVLAAADRYHASAVATGARKGDEWEPVGRRLHERLFRLQLERLETCASAGDWDGAAAYARTLADAYPDPKERAPVAARLVQMIRDGLRDNPGFEQLREARQRLRLMDEVFPGSEAMRPVADGLRAQAQALLNDAKGLRKAGQHQKAQERMQLAYDIWPSLPELADELATLEKDHPVLRVGVRELPTNMVPGQAVTDADLRALELMFEGLVKLRDLPGGGQRYEPALAGGPPRLIPLGREFRIARGAAWSDGTPVTVGDVRETLRAMRKADWPGYSPMWGKMIDDAEAGGDSFRLSLRLSQGYLDPLSLMTFKVMKQGRNPGANPVGSGPFKYKETVTVLDRKTAIFVANPYYAGRDGKLGLPRIREIHFILFAEQADDPAEALRAGRVDLVPDLPAVRAKDLRGEANLIVSGPTPNRRVYFLAVNHRAGPFKDNLALRRALALAIDRKKILDQFRDAPDNKALHHVLNGPFPTGSWPCDPKNVPAELYNPDEAKAQARKAVTEAGGPISLTLKYPAGDRITKAALEYLCTSVNNVLKLDAKTFVELKPQEVEPHKLREEVERTQNYELAYYHYDHPSEAYWIAPLFDLNATGMNGSNYLGYIDGALQTEFEQAKNHRDFSEVQQTMHLVHRMLEQKVPLIPLWQLDTFLAYRKGLKPTAVDPLLIFNDVERWTLEGKRAEERR